MSFNGDEGGIVAITNASNEELLANRLRHHVDR